MSTYHEQEFVIDSREVDLTGNARPSAVLGYLQEAATIASVKLHVSTPEMMERCRCFWMVARTWYRLDKPLAWDERVTVRTWHRGAKGVSSYRDYDLIQDGQLVGEGTSLWVLANADSGKLLRLDSLAEFQGTDGGELCKRMTLHRPKLPPMAPAGEQPTRYSDTDINGHVNNSKYADYACDALHLERILPGRFVSEFQIGYLNQCMAGETLRIETGEDANTLYVQGLGPKGDGRFTCAVTLSEIS